MADDADRAARILKLAHEVYGAREVYGRLSIERDTGGGADIVTESGGVLMAIGDHPRALEALEAALCILASESLPKLDRLPALVADLDVRLGDATAKLREVQELIAKLGGET